MTAETAGPAVGPPWPPKTNVITVLAQQCDMAREAETRQMEAERCLRKAEELLSEFVHSGVSFEDERIEYVEMQVGKSLIRDAMRWLHGRSNQDA